MRMRNKAWAAPELDACNFFVRHPAQYIGKWHDVFQRRQPIHLELGCGKGLFIAGLAPENPQINYIGIDLKDSVLAPAKRNIEQAFQERGAEPANVVLMAQDIERILTVMNSDDIVERIYINFCNPWPKAKHQKRRLTYPRQLENYKQILAKGGEIHFKTDDDPLFDDSLVYFEENGFEILSLTYDLHAGGYPKGVLTEHEKMFIDKGVKIKALVARLAAI
nr:tRNA (guanosine(46)-N7)-methyltransferase TrmB [uncultured Caproiciproducens sp.]